MLSKKLGPVPGLVKTIVDFGSGRGLHGAALRGSAFDLLEEFPPENHKLDVGRHHQHEVTVPTGSMPGWRNGVSLNMPYLLVG